LLGIHIFDVGQGDSILLELPDGSWGVVDCKMRAGAAQPPALGYLRDRGVERLAFVCLTHPHEDHYSGLPKILEYFGNNIDEFWCFRLDSQHWAKFFKVRDNAATTPSRKYQVRQLAEIFQRVEDLDLFAEDRVRLVDANHHIPNMGDVAIDCLAPSPKELSGYLSSLSRWVNHPEEYKADENCLSVVLRIRYGVTCVLLGSDASSESWMNINKYSLKFGDSILSNLVKVSHHGSKEGYFKGAWQTMSSPAFTHGAISAGGRYGHPSDVVLSGLVKSGVRLHCTNYGPSCLKTEEVDLSKFEGLPQSAKFQLFMLDQTASKKSRTCDGDLHFRLELDGRVEFAHQHAGLCPLHLPR